MMVEDRRTSPSDQQRKVTAHGLETPALVDAGAGTGKTFTIVERVAQLNADAKDGCPASAILLLTFSRKAAAELRNRIVRRLGAGVEPPECSTFHAFALSILKEHGFELDLSPDATLINEIDARVAFWKLFDDFIRGAVGSDAGAFALRYYMIDQVRKALFEIRQRLSDRGESVDAFRERALAAADEFARRPYRALYDPDCRTPKVALHQIDEAAFVREVAEERTRVDATATLFKAFEERLRERAALTYADLLRLAVKTVRQRPQVAATLRGRFRHCIVDEFQDTDPRQVDLIEAIFGAGCERVMVVGDPRQTIYGFRGIDPDNVAKFGAKPGCVPYALTENRRSRQDILDLAHAALHPQFDDPLPLRAVRASVEDEIIHVASRWSATGVKLNAARMREREAAWVAGKIVEMLSRGRRVESMERTGELEPIAPRHIAILSRRKTKLQPLIDALNAADLPFRQYGGAGFYDAPEVLDALAWLRLVTEPLDDKAVGRVLSSAAVGCSDASIATLCAGMHEGGSSIASRALVEDVPSDLDAEGRNRIERFRKTIRALQDYAGAPLVVAWEATIDRAGIGLTADLRSGRRTDQARANVEKLSAMVRSFAERNPGARAADFDRYIVELTEADADDQEADPPAADAVSVMTIHAAKGLEWPIVFLIDVWPLQPADNSSVKVDSATGALLVSEGPDGTKPFHTESIDGRDDGHGNITKEARRDPSRAREELRLFYVALTRARDELFVSGWRRISKTHPNGTIHPYLATVIERIEQLGWKTLDEPAPEGARYSGRGLRDGDRVMPLGDFVMERPIRRNVSATTLSFSSISQFEQCPRSVTYRVAYGLPGFGRAAFDDALESSVDGGTMRSRDSLLSAGTYGDLVHRALETWGRSPGDAPAAYVTAAIGDLRLDPSKDERERATASVRDVIAALTGWRPIIVEAPFTLELGGVEVTGFIDLIAENPHGDIVIVDYKTGVTEAAHYALQLALYRIAASKAYGKDVAACSIVRIGSAGASLEAVDSLEESEVHDRVAGVAARIRAADVTATPGPQCATCAYRDAPCLDYAKTTVPEQLTMLTT